MRGLRWVTTTVASALAIAVASPAWSPQSRAKVQLVRRPTSPVGHPDFLGGSA